MMNINTENLVSIAEGCYGLCDRGGYHERLHRRRQCGTTCVGKNVAGKACSHGVDLGGFEVSQSQIVRVD